MPHPFQIHGGLRTGFGMLLIVLGLIAIPIPVIPGFPILAAGAALLGPDHPWIRPWRPWLQSMTSRWRIH